MDFWDNLHVNTRGNILLCAGFNPQIAQFSWKELPAPIQQLILAYIEKKKEDIIEYQ